MDIIAIPWGLTFWDFLLFDIGLTLIIELPILNMLLRCGARRGLIMVLIANLSSVFFGIFFVKTNYLEILTDPQFWRHLTIDSWQSVELSSIVMLPFTIGVELVSYLVLAWYWLRVRGSHVNWGKVVLSCFTVNTISWPIMANLGYNITVLSYSAREASFMMFPIVFDVTVLLVIIIALYCFNRMGVLREK